MTTKTTVYGKSNKGTQWVGLQATYRPISLKTVLMHRREEKKSGIWSGWGVATKPPPS